MSWHEAVKRIRPYVVKISTPEGSGTGWLVSRSVSTGLCAIATAAHVIQHAHYWEEPVRLFHEESGKSVVLRRDDRAILVDENLDSAAIIFGGAELPLPETLLPLLEQGYCMKPGVEIGWLGFPGIPQAGGCFFSGRISTYIGPMSAYLVDGVAINGVSGGPAFTMVSGEGLEPFCEMIGLVSAYIPNRATGESLPGVAVVRDVTQFHDVSARFRSLDEAKEQESSIEPAAPEPLPSTPTNA